MGCVFIGEFTGIYGGIAAIFQVAPQLLLKNWKILMIK